MTQTKLKKINENRSIYSFPVLFILVVSIYSACAFSEIPEYIKNLENKCEEKRELLLAPLRRKAIEECVVKNRNSKEYCTRYFRNYGNTRPTFNGTYKPRLFHDIPECIKAYNSLRDRQLHK